MDGPLVGVIMGSRSDWETMRARRARRSRILGVPYETRVVSAHRTPDLMSEYARTAADRGLQVMIAGAGGAAHLPGMTAAKTHLPVLGVPVESKALKGMDSLLSIAQMPAGVPVGTLAIGRAGAVNAALLAAAIVALDDEERAASGCSRFRAAQTQRRARRTPTRRRMTTRRVGIVGGGQLGRMLALAGRTRSAIALRDARPGRPTRRPRRSAPSIVGAYDDPEALARLAARVDVLTYEFENVPVEAARLAEQRAPCSRRPPRSRRRRTGSRRRRCSPRWGCRAARSRPSTISPSLEAALEAVGPAGGAEDRGGSATTARARR